MRQLVMVPDGWPCRFGDLRPGFFTFQGRLGLRTEYHEAAFMQLGDAFWGGTSDYFARRALEVQPVKPEWQEVEE